MPPPTSSLSLLTAALLLTTSDGSAASPPQPPQADAAPQPPAAFHIMPLFNRLTASTGSPNWLEDEIVAAQMVRLKEQLGPGRRHFKVGFAAIVGDEENAGRNFRLASEHGLSLGMIVSAQTHALGAEYNRMRLADIRLFQWRLDGSTWFAAPIERPVRSTPVPDRDKSCITPSRYARDFRAAVKANVLAKGELLVRMDRRFPGVLAVVNPVIEQELAEGGNHSDDYLGDYSPFAVAEFRDWLRHTGDYDATTGRHAGQGASELITGPYQSIGGILRSPFHDDPTPDDSDGSGVSFNQAFGTNFTSWALRYYDLDAFPEPIRFVRGMEDQSSPRFFDITPQSGRGFTAGGFDAPRTRDINNRFWLAWSWDMLDHADSKPGLYPPGDPAAPAFGFRQVMVRNWVTDVMDWLHQTGVPAHLLYAHQIPAEAVTPSRLRSSASPTWTGFYQSAATVGITKFGKVDHDLMLRYANHWGIFEWHPLPRGVGSLSTPEYEARLHAAVTSSLDHYYWTGARFLFPGWWSHDGGIHQDGNFPLADSSFTVAIRDWIKTQRERPPPRLSTGKGLRTRAAGKKVEFTGWIMPIESGPHRFTLSGGDESSLLVIDGKKVPTRGAGRAAAAAQVRLEAGSFYPITLTHDPDTTPQLHWSSETMPRVPVPLTQLHSHKP